MKSKDIFSLAVRILGLVILYHLLLASPLILHVFLGGRIEEILIGLVGIAAALAIIWWLIGGAPLLMRHAYPETSKDEPLTAEKYGRKADA